MDNKICNRCGRELPNNNQYFPMDKGKTRAICKECDPKYGKFLRDGETSPKKWSQEEVKLLTDNYANFTNEELQQMFFKNRSIRAIESYASKMKCGHKTEITMQRSFKSGAIKNNQKGKKFTQQHKKHISESKKKLFNPDDNDLEGQLKAKRIKDEIGKHSSERWSGENNPRHLHPLYGNENGRWQGGVVPLSKHLREEIIDWKNRSIKFCEYKCVITGGRFGDIHHITPLSDIIDESLDDIRLSRMSVIGDYSSNEYQDLKNAVIKKHEYTEYGCCLHKKIHTLFHSVYGYTGNNIFQIADFFIDIKNGKYNNFLLHNHLTVNINEKYFNYIMEVRDEYLCAS